MLSVLLQSLWLVALIFGYTGLLVTSFPVIRLAIRGKYANTFFIIMFAITACSILSLASSVAYISLSSLDDLLIPEPGEFSPGIIAYNTWVYMFIGSMGSFLALIFGSILLVGWLKVGLEEIIDLVKQKTREQ